MLSEMPTADVSGGGQTMGVGATDEVGGGSVPPIGKLQQRRTAEITTTMDQPSTDPPAQTEPVPPAQPDTRLATLLGDQELVEELRETGFNGANYEVFKAALASYGYPVIQAWIKRGQIFQLTADRGRPVACSDSVRAYLAAHADDRRELAMEVVANGLVLFRERALVKGMWRPEGGATLTTFFIGSCVLVFANVFRTWLNEHAAEQRARHIETDPSMDRVSTDPADVVCAMDTFCRILESVPSDEIRRVLAALVVEDASYATIAQRLGTTEAAIKMRMTRFRRKHTQDGGLTP